ncbi:MAG TPA: ABC transporter permease, partial [Anseongella sp.]|nr:ABC transporter permease [Anseongella sp.]
MKNMFSKAFQAEVLKSKRSFVLWLTAGCALFIPLVWILALIFKSESLLPSVSPAPWDFLFMKAYQSSTLLLPFFIVLLVNLIVHIEHRA